jgi:hydrogenase nickel incorporation protein HypA/HybF
VHEFGLCEAIVDTARLRAQGRPVRRLLVRVGDDLLADVESMRMIFALLSEGTELEGARLDLVAGPGDRMGLVSLDFTDRPSV